MTFPVKDVRIANKTYPVAGLSNSDLYFGAITDDFEPDFHAFCRRFIQDDYVCVDIGANIGMKSLMLSQYAQYGRVIAVEASPEVGQVLALNVERSGERNISVCHCAVSDNDGQVGFAGNSAYGHISQDGEKVPAKRLSTVLAEHGLTRCDFIKIDVEGYEYPILRDSLATINEHGSLVLFEFNSWCQIAHADVAPLAFARWIVENFSHVYMIRRSGTAMGELQRVPPDGALTLLHTNMVDDTCLSDILVTNAPERLSPTLAHLQRQEAEMSARCDALTARLAAVESELDKVRHERDALLSSTSWRLSAPLRAVGRMIKGRD